MTALWFRSYRTRLDVTEVLQNLQMYYYLPMQQGNLTMIDKAILYPNYFGIPSFCVRYTKILYNDMR